MIDKLLTILLIEVIFPIKKDFIWLGKIITKDLEKLNTKKNVKKSQKK